MSHRTGITGGTVSGMVAAADYRTKRYYAMVESTIDTATLAGAGVHIRGVLVNEPNIGKVAEVQTSGQTKGVAGAAITTQGLLTTDSSGRFILASGAGVKFNAVALETAAAAGNIIDIELIGAGVLHA